MRYAWTVDSERRLRIRLFGAPEIHLDGRSVEFDTRKAVALLAYVATTEQAHQRDAVAAMLWPDYDQSRARAALRRTLSSLRKGLEDLALEVDRSTVGLDLSAAEIDVVTFRRLLGGLTASDPDAAPAPEDLERLRAAAALYRGDLLAGFTLRDSAEFDDWHFFEAESLRRELASALELLSRWSLDGGQAQEAVEHARRWVSLDPLHEPAQQFLMRGYAAAGDRAGVVRQYRELVRVLDEELGVPPLSETTSLYEELTVATGSAHVSSTPTRADRVKTEVDLPFVGRAAPLRDAVRLLQRARERGSMLVIEGEAGVGKSRLVDEVVIGSGGAAVRAAAHASSAGLAYAVVADLIQAALRVAPSRALEPRVRSEIARLVPAVEERGDPPVPGLDQPGALAGFFEAIARLVSRAAGAGASAVVVDDLQWADEASLDALSHLARRVSDHAYLLIFVWRSEEVGPGHRLRALMSELRREGQATEIRVERLARTDAEELVRASGLGDEATATRLFEESEGLPFFLVEYLRAIEAGSSAMPTGARDLLTTRLARASETARQVLTAAAVLRGPSDVDLIRETSGRTEDETVAALDELVAGGVLRVADDADYAFGHEKMRELAYDDAGPARRRSLHRRAAEVLRARIRRGGDEALYAALAHHLSSSGAEREAATASMAAGDHARTLFANEDALRHYERALALHPADIGGLHEAIGDVCVLMGDYERALLSLERAAASSAPERLAELEAKIAEVHQRAGQWELAEIHHVAALEAAGDDHPVLRARIAADRSLTARRRGDLEAARDLALEGLELASSAEDAAALARVRNILGVICLAEGDATGAVEHLERSLVASEALADPSARIAALNNLASAHRTAGEFEEALRYAGAALELCSSQGDRHREAALHSNMADLLHATDRSDEALVHLKEAAALFTSIGGSTSEPEIWKLVEW